MPLINCNISLQLKWSKNCILVAGTVANQNPSFQINDTRFYIQATNQAQNRYLDFLIDMHFQRVNRLCFSFKDDNGQESRK